MNLHLSLSFLCEEQASMIFEPCHIQVPKTSMSTPRPLGFRLIFCIAGSGQLEIRCDSGWWFGTSIVFFHKLLMVGKGNHPQMALIRLQFTQMNLMFPYIENHHPNWLSYFSEGIKLQTTNQDSIGVHSDTRWKKSGGRKMSPDAQSPSDVVVFRGCFHDPFLLRNSWLNYTKKKQAVFFQSNFQCFSDICSFAPGIFFTPKLCPKIYRSRLRSDQDDLSPCPESTPKTQEDQGGVGQSSDFCWAQWSGGIASGGPVMSGWLST